MWNKIIFFTLRSLYTNWLLNTLWWWFDFYFIQKHMSKNPLSTLYRFIGTERSSSQTCRKCCLSSSLCKCSVWYRCHRIVPIDGYPNPFAEIHFENYHSWSCASIYSNNLINRNQLIFFSAGFNGITFQVDSRYTINKWRTNNSYKQSINNVLFLYIFLILHEYFRVQNTIL